LAHWLFIDHSPFTIAYSPLTTHHSRLWLIGCWLKEQTKAVTLFLSPFRGLGGVLWRIGALAYWRIGELAHWLFIDHSQLPTHYSPLTTHHSRFLAFGVLAVH